MLITHEWMTFADDGGDERDSPEAIEVVEAGGEGDYVGATRYTIVKSRDGRFGYSVSIGDLDRTASPACAAHSCASREEALSHLADELIAILTAVIMPAPET